MASIVKRPRNRNKPWAVRWYDSAGRQRETAFRLKGEASDFKIKQEHDTRAGIFVDPRLGSEPFAVAAERYIDQLAVTPATRRAYRSVLSNQIAPVLGDRTLLQAGSDRDRVTALLNVGLAGLSDSRREIARAVIAGVLDEAVIAGKLAQHRVGGIKLTTNGIAPDRSDWVFPDKAELDRLAAGLGPAKGAPHRELALTIWLMRGCGLRISEALAIRESCLSGDTLRVAEQVSPDGRAAIPLKHRKPGEGREIPAPAYVREVLAAHVAGHGTRDGYLFTGARTPYVQHRGYLKAFTTAAEAAGIGEGFTPHSLRHVFASALLARGVPITDVARWLGHRSIQVTYGIYGHLVPSALGKATEVLDAEYAEWSHQDAA